MSQAVSPEIQRFYDKFPTTNFVCEKRCAWALFAIGLIFIIGGVIAAKVLGDELGFVGSYGVQIAGGSIGLTLCIYACYRIIHPFTSRLQHTKSAEHQAVTDMALEHQGARFVLQRELEGLSSWDARRDLISASLDIHSSEMEKNARVMKGFMWKITASNGSCAHLIAATSSACTKMTFEPQDLLHPTIKEAIVQSDQLYADSDWLKKAKMDHAKPSHFGHVIRFADEQNKALKHLLGTDSSATQQKNKNTLQRLWDENRPLEIYDALQWGKLESLQDIVTNDLMALFPDFASVKQKVCEGFALNLGALLLEDHASTAVVLDATFCVGEGSILSLLEKAAEGDSEKLTALRQRLGAVTIERIALD